MRHSRLNGLNAEEKYVYSKECRGVYLFSPSHVRLLLEVGALSIKCIVKHCVFRKRVAALFALKDDKVIRGGALRLNAKVYCVFRKSAAALIFVRLILRAAFFRVYTVWIAFAGFITFVSQRSTQEFIRTR